MGEPRCDRHGPMVERPVREQTEQQVWCGTWFDCEDPRCTTSFLTPSPELVGATEEGPTDGG